VTSTADKTQLIIKPQVGEPLDKFKTTSICCKFRILVISMAKGKAGKVRASHILVDKHSQALALISRIREGDDFRNIAKQYSTCPSKKKGGDLGWFTKGQMVPEFEKAAFKLNVGAMTNEPVKTKFGYHIIKRTG
jgi:peptidyl-prolyl cis-trans isomerase C